MSTTILFSSGSYSISQEWSNSIGYVCIFNRIEKYCSTAFFSPFKNLSLNPCNLLVANYSLSFCDEKNFENLWNKIVNSISKNGYFVGNFFGKNDSWSKKTNMTFFTKKEVLNLFSSFEIINFLEIEKDDKTALGKQKHWHIFDIIAKKK